jgi:hypothetical protein
LLTTVTLLGGVVATALHTAAYLAVTGLIAWVVDRKLGLALLPKTWFDIDLIWPSAVVATGVITVIM